MATRPFTGTSYTIRQGSQKRDSKVKTWIDKVLSKKGDTNTRDLEEVIDLDRDYNNFTTRELATIDPKQLYKLGTFERKSGLYKKQREDILKVGDGDAITIDLISKEAGRQLIDQGYHMAHIGLIILGIKPLHRGGLSKRAVLTISDNGMGTEEDQLIASIEADMSQKAGIFYCAPNTINKILTIQRHFKIGIMTTGYGAIEHENLAVTVAVLGRLSSSTASKYKLNISSIVEAAATHGIEMIPAHQEDPRKYIGTTWDLSRLLKKNTQALIPKRNTMFRHADGSISLRFHEYNKQRKAPDSDDEDDS